MTYRLSPQDAAMCKAISARHHSRVKEIALAVTAECGLPISAIYGKSKKRHIVQARWLVMRLARDDGMTLQQIATALGLDHTTVVHGMDREAELRAKALA